MVRPREDSLGLTFSLLIIVLAIKESLAPTSKRAYTGIELVPVTNILEVFTCQHVNV